MVSTKTKERQTENNDQHDPWWLEGIHGGPILHQLCHTAQSHFSKQVLERKLQGHELETVLLPKFLIERLINTGISENNPATLKDF